MVSVGQKAPDFFASAYTDGRGEPFELVREIEAHDAVVLLFAPADFVPACTAEWTAVRRSGWHGQDGLAVVGITGDSLFSHAAYAEQAEIPFRIVSDFHAGVAAQYSLTLEEWEGHRQIPGRAAVVIDSDWEVRALETADPLAEASLPPAGRVTQTLLDMGFDIEQPTVEYGSGA